VKVGDLVKLIDLEKKFCDVGVVQECKEDNTVYVFWSKQIEGVWEQAEDLEIISES